MVYKCVAAGCSNSSSSSTTLYEFPKDPRLRHEWEGQVQRTRAQWKATKYSHLCSEHFTEDCFEAESHLAAGFGIKMRKKLKRGAIPTVFPRQSSSQSHAAMSSRKRPAPSSESVGQPSRGTKKRAAVEKRERRQVATVALRPRIPTIYNND